MTPLPNAWTLDPDTLAEAVALRHEMHRCPEVSGAEHETAKRIASRMRALGAEVATGLGGTGVAAVFGAGDRTLMIRAELDALPILEAEGPEHRSEVDGVGHLCGHDGHMAILFAVASALSRHAPAIRVVLLFQPAEETGAGARAVLDDPKFAALRPIWQLLCTICQSCLWALWLCKRVRWPVPPKGCMSRSLAKPPMPPDPKMAALRGWLWRG